MRKTRLVIQPTRCLHGIGFLLLFMSFPVFGDWGLVQPESEAAQMANSLQRESAKMVLKDPPDAILTEHTEPSSWAYRTDFGRRITPSSERRWLDVRNQRISPERSELLREARQNEMRNFLPRRVENRQIMNSRRILKKPNEGAYRLHEEVRLASPSRRLVRREVQSESARGIRVHQSRQTSQIRSNQRLLRKDLRTSNLDDQHRSIRKIDESTQPSSRTASLRRSDTRSSNVQERNIVRKERQSTNLMNSENRRSFQQNDRQSRENTRQERENRINNAEEMVVNRRSSLIRRSERSIDQRREENRASERIEPTSRTSAKIERNEIGRGNRGSFQETDQQRSTGRHNSVRKVDENRIGNADAARRSAERRVSERGERQNMATRRINSRTSQGDGQRKVENAERQESSQGKFASLGSRKGKAENHIVDRRSSTNLRNVRKNNERREVELSSRLINSSIRTRVSGFLNMRERSLDRKERQYTSTRSEDRRASNENDQQRRKGERQVLPQNEKMRRESRSSYGDLPINQGDNLRRKENNNERRLTTRLDQETMKRSTRSVSHQNNQRSDNLLMRSRVDIRVNERDRLGQREKVRSIIQNRRSEENIRENRQGSDDFLMRKNEARVVRTARSISRELRDQNEGSMDRRLERGTIGSTNYRKERVERKTSIKREIRDTIRSMPLVRSQYEKESVMRNSQNEIRVSSRKENNNNREMTKAVELSKEIRNERDMFTKKPYTQDSVDRMFQDNNENWISYKKIAGNCLLGAIAYFVTTRNPKIAY